MTHIKNILKKQSSVAQGATLEMMAGLWPSTLYVWLPGSTPPSAASSSHLCFRMRLAIEIEIIYYMGNISVSCFFLFSLLYCHCFGVPSKALLSDCHPLVYISVKIPSFRWHWRLSISFIEDLVLFEGQRK